MKEQGRGQRQIREQGGDQKREREKAAEREITLWLLHSFNVTVKGASTGNVVIP